MHQRIVIVIALISCWTSTQTGATEPVNQYGNVNCFVFEGLTSFHPEAVRKALLWNPDFQRAVAPSAPLDNLLQTTKAILQTGYLHAGFPQARITVRKSILQEEILITITEGPRLNAGKVEFAGAEQLNTDKLRQHLISPQAKSTPLGKAKEANQQPTSTPFWQPGEPAPLDPATLQKIEKQLKRACRNQGFVFAELASKVEIDLASGTALLKVTVTNEGPLATAETIQIEGLKNNRREDLLTLLSLEPNSPINQQSLSQWNRNLWESARFTKFAIAPRINDDQVQLEIKLLEYEDAPPLGQPLPEEAKALLRIQQWLSGFAQSPHELVVSYQPTATETHPKIPLQKAKLVLAPKKGLYLEVAGAPNHSYAGHHHFILNSSQLGIYNHQSQQCFLTGGLRIQPSFSIAMVPSFDEATNKTSSDLQLGLGVKSLDEDTIATPFQANLEFAPVVFLRESLKATNKISISNGQILVQNESLVCQADLQTGKIETINFPKLPGLQIKFQTGAWQQIATQENVQSANFENGWQAAKPLETFLQFLLNETFWQLESNREKAIVAGRRRAIAELTATALKAAETQLKNHQRVQRDKFKIPNTNPTSQDQLLGTLLLTVPVIIDPWFPRGSWPWTLTRQTALTMAGKGQHSIRELQRVLDNEPLGPVGYWAIAEFLKKFGSPKYQPFASHALSTLNTNTLYRDTRLLLNQDTWTGQAIAAIGKNLKDMKPATVAELTRSLPTSMKQFVQQWSASIEQHPQRPTTELFLEALEKQWQQELSSLVARRLKELITPDIRIARPPEPANTPKTPR